VLAIAQRIVLNIRKRRISSSLRMSQTDSRIGRIRHLNATNESFYVFLCNRRSRFPGNEHSHVDRHVNESIYRYLYISLIILTARIPTALKVFRIYINSFYESGYPVNCAHTRTRTRLRTWRALIKERIDSSVLIRACVGK